MCVCVCCLVEDVFWTRRLHDIRARYAFIFYVFKVCPYPPLLPRVGLVEVRTEQRCPSWSLWKTDGFNLCFPPVSCVSCPCVFCFFSQLVGLETFCSHAVSDCTTGAFVPGDKQTFWLRRWSNTNPWIRDSCAAQTLETLTSVYCYEDPEESWVCIWLDIKQPIRKSAGLKSLCCTLAA